MQVILTQDVENLGLEFDTVDVKPGYARNYLIPQGYAVLATPKERAQLANTLEERREIEAQLIATANTMIDQLKNTTLVIETKVGSGNKLFGSINNANLSEELAKNGVEVDRKYIKIPGNTIKRTGKFEATIRPHREVEYTFEFDVISDAPVVKEAPAKKAAPAKTEEENTTEEEQA